MNSGDCAYIWQAADWPNWRFDLSVLAGPMAEVSRAQGMLLGRLADVGMPWRDQASLAALTDVVTTEFDVAFLDLDLPGLDGMALARQLRLQGVPMPLVALTARTDAEAEPLAREAGFDDFVRKPVTGDMLADVIARMLGQASVASPGEQGGDT